MALYRWLVNTPASLRLCVGRGEVITNLQSERKMYFLRMETGLGSHPECCLLSRKQSLAEEDVKRLCSTCGQAESQEDLF